MRIFDIFFRNETSKIIVSHPIFSDPHPPKRDHTLPEKKPHIGKKKYKKFYLSICRAIPIFCKALHIGCRHLKKKRSCTRDKDPAPSRL